MIELEIYRGESTRLNNLPITDGNLIITTDDGKMYADVGNERIPVGGADLNLANGTGTNSLEMPNSTATGANAFAEGSETTASGNNSHAEGLNTQATGGNAHSEGAKTVAGGPESHAEGYATKAIGNHSHAEGSTSVAQGEDSHAEGQRTIATGIGAHSEGKSTDYLSNYGSLEDAIARGGFTVASGRGAHAEGWDTRSTNYASHSEGRYTKATGEQAHAEGYYSEATANNAHAEGGNTLASGDNSHAEGSNTIASGPQAHAEGFETQATSRDAHAEGTHTVASGMYSHAEGFESHAEGLASHAEGASTAKYDYSHAEGWHSEAKAGNAHAEGGATIASGQSSHSEGENTVASGVNAHAEGNSTEASGADSHAEGYEAKASGKNTHAEGCQTQATNDHAHAEGNETIAGGTESHAEGYNTKAMGKQSHAEGGSTQTMEAASWAHAEGLETEAHGTASHAEGYKTKALHNNSHAEGAFTQTSRENQHVEGRYNRDEATAYHIIGCGANANNRDNCFTAGVIDGVKYIKVGNTFISEGDLANLSEDKIVIVDGVNGWQPNPDGSYSSTVPAEVINQHVNNGMLVCLKDQNGLLLPLQSCDQGTATFIYVSDDGFLTSYTIDTTSTIWVSPDYQLITVEESAKIWNIITTINNGTAAQSLIQVSEKTDTAIKLNFADVPNVGSLTGADGQPIAREYNRYDESNVTTAAFGTSVAKGKRAFAGGSSNVAAGKYSIALGADNYVAQDAGVGLGYANYSNGFAAIATGQSTQALADGAHTEGMGTTASGKYAHAEGCDTEATQENAHAEGYGSKATAVTAHAEGNITVASGPSAHAEGYDTEASGDHSHAEGNETLASGVSSHAEGYLTKATGNGSHTEGYETKATGACAHAEGSYSQALDETAHAEGYGTYAKGRGGHTEGEYTRAYQKGAHAEGIQTLAGDPNSYNGEGAHAEGYFTEAKHSFSHTSGDHTRSSKNAQTVVGAYNTDNSNAMFIVGRGTGEGNRLNGFESLDDGRAVVGADPINPMDVATKQYVDNQPKAIAEYNDVDWTTFNWTQFLGKPIFVKMNFVSGKEPSLNSIDANGNEVFGSATRPETLYLNISTEVTSDYRYLWIETIVNGRMYKTSHIINKETDSIIMHGNVLRPVLDSYNKTEVDTKLKSKIAIYNNVKPSTFDWWGAINQALGNTEVDDSNMQTGCFQLNLADNCYFTGFDNDWVYDKNKLNSALVNFTVVYFMDGYHQISFAITWNGTTYTSNNFNSQWDAEKGFAFTDIPDNIPFTKATTVTPISPIPTSTITALFS